MKVIAHRGASAYAPENTLKAFELAVEMGSRDFEFDVHRTADGVLVVHHYYDLRLTAGKKAVIGELSYEELKRFNVAAHRRGAGFQSVPRLCDVIDVIAPGADWLNFELKNDGNVYPGIEAELLAFIRSRKGLMEKTLISSFDHPSLKRLRALAPASELKLGCLNHGFSALPPAALRRARALGAVNFHISRRVAFKLNVSRIKKAGFNVCVYTVNTKKEAQRMQSIGVDGIFSNHPDIMGEWKLKG